MNTSTISYAVAFGAGVITFFTSCLLPLVPAYVIYLTGSSIQDAQNKKGQIIQTSLFFTLGFIILFVLIGAGVGMLGRLLNPYMPMLQFAAGIFFIVFGLSLLRIINSTILSKSIHIPLQNIHTRFRSVHAFLTGASFAIGWTPCVGPILSTILFWSSQQATIAQGTALLIMYGVGMGIPFIIFGLFINRFNKYISSITRYSRFIEYFAGIIIIIIGILLLTGKLGPISIRIVSLFGIDSLSQ